MSDRIRVRTEWLDQCARDFGQVAGALADARSTLSGITLRRDEGGELKVSMDCSLKLVGQKFTGSNAEEDVKQLARAARSSPTTATARSPAATRTGATGRR